MFYINKLSSSQTVDLAAEELKKYLLMMMPCCGGVQISHITDAVSGFKLGLMQELSIPIPEGTDPILDDIIYIDCDESGGIIAGANPRAVLLAVYEYLRQNGCRWLMPGVNGEYIPIKDIVSVKLSYIPSCRYRGSCLEGDETQYILTDFIDFLPKVGMNTFMMQFELTKGFFRRYYAADHNKENRRGITVSDGQIVQWKKLCEYELAKRGLCFHDIGHGFTVDPFGVRRKNDDPDFDANKYLTDEKRQYLAELDGVRRVHNPKSPAFTNFCMSNATARAMVADYVKALATKNPQIDYLHVWLADGTNNHCECPECKKKTPSDFYMMLMNEIDERLTEAGLRTKIVFICYVDTFWATLEESIRNTERFSMLFAPIFRSYAYSMPTERSKTEIAPYRRNDNEFPPDLASSLDYLDEWRKKWSGSVIAFEYHFWRHHYYSISGIMQARLLNDDVKLYKNNGLDGVIACGTQRCFFPSGLQFYSYARTLFDTSLSYETIEEDYLSHALGENWREFRDYFVKLEEALPFEYFSRDEAAKREDGHYSPEMSERIEKIREITKDGRALISSYPSSGYIVHITMAELLLRHADLCDLISDWMAAKAKGEIEKAAKLYHVARVQFGKYEKELERYFDHGLCFMEYSHTQAQKSKSVDNVVAID